ncbi:hypothetical protein, partial [Paraburkholderia ultramafica]|uniref:hypothetical protein n=1 Tax=Paraburkholderia ultramafica TaxID=1544867 RepID=UPI001C2EB125
LADRCPTSKRPTLRRRRGMQTAYLDPLRTATASSREWQHADYDGREIPSVTTKIDAAYSLVL